MKLSLKLEEFRERSGLYESDPGDTFGRFFLPGPNGRDLCVVASSGMEGIPWEHVSVSVIGRHVTPAWNEMCYVKDLFWDDEEVVIQFHPAKSQYINMHPGCLHLWKPTDTGIPMPPPATVGLKGVEVA